MRIRFLGRCEILLATGERADTIIAQPKRLALLAYLAASMSHGPRTRDRLVALFWPELDDATARHALRQALYHLRQALGADVVLSQGDFVELAPNVDCDVQEFERVLAQGRAETALELYVGEFLDGFHASDVSAEFSQWLDDERQRLRNAAIEGALQSATAAEQHGDLPRVDRLLRRVAELAPFDERVLRRRLEVLERSSDRASAVLLFDQFADRLRRELDVDPSPETRALAARLRTANEPIEIRRHATVRHNELSEGRPIVAGKLPVPSKARRPYVAWLSAAGFAAAAIVLAVKGAARDPQPVLAVGGISDRTGMDSLRLGLTMRGLLASELLRIRDLAVLSEGRLLEFRLPTDALNEQHALTEAARRAGATDIIEGTLYRLRRDSLRLDLRRVSLANNLLRGSVTVIGRDPFAMAAEAVERLGERMAREVLPNAVAGVSTQSLSARRLYQEGLQAFYALDFTGALRLFESALSDDSTFAMAALHASRAALWRNDYSRRAELLRHAVRAVSHASDRERLIILADWAEARNDTTWRAVAETLAVRYPAEPDGAYALGRALLWRGDFVRARQLLLDAAARDSAALVLRSGSAWCRACDALYAAITADLLADSLGSAESIARKWLKIDSTSAGAFGALAEVLQRQGKIQEALSAAQLSWRHIPGGIDDAELRAKLAIRAGDYASADGILTRRAADLRPDVQAEALWWQMVSLRQQGRMQEALGIARRFRIATQQRQGANAALRSSSHQQRSLIDVGRVTEATALGDSMLSVQHTDSAHFAGEEWAGGVARYRSWTMLHLAESVAASGDTVRLRRLADSLEVTGRVSAFGRDQLAHYHVRGLLFLARGDTAAALRVLRAAIYSPTGGYTRTNYVLGRVLTARGQATAAITVLEPALRGDLQASNLYVTRTELHEALGEAYAKAGERIQARDAFRRVAAAWAGGDLPYRSRAARAARLARY
ncbi:MAG TPA: BTAD domain-containing putative transcriptional regulator [Gemmatimonadaceae bacterium]|nr:BTAD domain-containing putative transcriptional regulator [Gemmatimonadaceae bacterium]